MDPVDGPILASLLGNAKMHMVSYCDQAYAHVCRKMCGLGKPKKKESKSEIFINVENHYGTPYLCS